MSIRVVGRVTGGHLRVDIPVELPENTEVMLAEAPIAAEEDEDPELAAALDRAEQQAACGEGASWEEVRARLHARARRDETLSDTSPSRG